MAKTETLTHSSPAVSMPPIIVMPAPNSAPGVDITPTAGALALSPEVAEMPAPEPAKPSEIVRHIFSRRYPAGELFEIRATVPNGTENLIYAGLYNDHDAAINDVKWLTEKTSASAIYTNLQRIKDSEEYQRAVTNKLIQGKGTASACDIAQYVRLLIDVDTTRPAEFAKSSSTDAEKAAAFEIITNIKNYMEDLGFSGDLYDSGNGYHNIYALDLPATEDSKLLLKTVLHALEQKFRTDCASVDTSVYDMPRVCKLIGSYARKGQHTTERPHRLSKILSEATELKPIPADVLLKITGLRTAPKVRVQEQAASEEIEKSLDYLRGFVDWAGLTIQNEKPHEDGVILVLESDCPFEHKSGHHAGECHVGVNKEAKLAFACKHDSCAGRGWKQFRAEIEKQKRGTYTHGLIVSAEPRSSVPPSVEASVLVQTDAQVPVATDAAISVTENNKKDSRSDVILNEALPDFPKMTGSLADLSHVLDPDVPFEFKFMSAATNFGLMRSGLDRIESEPNLQPRFYTTLIAKPYRGKTAAMEQVTGIFEKLVPRSLKGFGSFSVTESIDSGPGLIHQLFLLEKQQILTTTDGLEIGPTRLLIQVDEMGDLFEKGKVITNSKNTILSELLKLYTKNKTSNNAKGNKKKEEVRNAHVATLGGATPERYGQMWAATAGAASGLQSRGALVGSNSGRVLPIRTLTDVEALGEVMLRIAAQLNAEGRRIRWSGGADKTLQEWAMETLKEDRFADRVDDVVKRLLIVLAATNDTDELSPALVLLGIEFGDYLYHLRKRFDPADAWGYTQMFENLILDFMAKYPHAVTLDGMRKMLHPEKQPGGVGAFLQATKNLISAGFLREAGCTDREKLYRLG